MKQYWTRRQGIDTIDGKTIIYDFSNGDKVVVDTTKKHPLADVFVTIHKQKSFTFIVGKTESLELFAKSETVQDYASALKEIALHIIEKENL